jgi:hypothetical protein
MKTREPPENEKHIEVQITLPGSPKENPKLVLPRAMFDSFSTSEKKALPKMFEQYVSQTYPCPLQR